MAILVDKAGLVAVAIDDTARALIRPGQMLMVIGCLIEDHGDVVQVRFGDRRVGQHLWVPRDTIAIIR